MGLRRNLIIEHTILAKPNTSNKHNATSTKGASELLRQLGNRDSSYMLESPSAQETGGGQDSIPRTAMCCATEIGPGVW